MHIYKKGNSVDIMEGGGELFKKKGPINITMAKLKVFTI